LVLNTALSLPLDAEEHDNAFLGVERSASDRRWVSRLDEAGARAALGIAQKHGLPELVARVLAGRGIGEDAVSGFLDPSVRSLMPDPDRLTDMGAAAERIADAIIGGERIAIFGDYDVDGGTSAALLGRFLRWQGSDPAIYIPDRLIEGYGPKPESVQALAGAGARLLVAVDCGTTSFDAFEAAKRIGLDVVVIDHHQAGHALPQTWALVNPNRPDDISGLGHLAAVGLTFMTAVAINRVLRRRGWYSAGRAEPDLLSWLDLVALGTVCDVVPLTGLNRAFVAKGLAAMRRNGNAGIAALRRVARLNGSVTCQSLGFVIGPRINAGGRIGDAALGVRLLLSDDPSETEMIAAQLDRLNQERQGIESRALVEAMVEAEGAIGNGEGPAVLITRSAEWHPGVVGLIAARLKERFRRPAFAVALGPDGQGTGSGRSVPGIDLGHAVRAAVDAGLLVAGGGHAMAAGITVRRDRLEELGEFFEREVGAAVRTAATDRRLVIDAALTARGATTELVDLLDKAGPYGSGHPEPVFALPAQRIGYVETVGSAHIRVSLVTGDGASLKAMAFRAADTPLGAALLKSRGLSLHVAGTLSADEWQGRRRAELRILDVAEPGR
jgi:single-stranded-DNA-specific exonuclease